MSNQQATSCPPPPAPVPPNGRLASKNDKSVGSDSDRGWAYQRNRGLPTPDPNETVISQIKFFLDKYRIKEATHLFFQDATLRLLSDEPDFMWEVIPVICQRLRGLCQYRFRVFEGCEKMLTRIAASEGCNPKEVLISFLAEISNEDDNVFRAMIHPLEICLERMESPSPRDENLRWVINILMRHLNNIEISQDFEIEAKVKRPAGPNCPYVMRYVDVLPLMLNFIDTFTEPPEYDSSTLPILTQDQIDVVLNGELADDDESVVAQSRSTETFITALMNLIYRPLTFLDLTSICTSIRFIANRHLVKLIKLKPNLFSPIYKRINDRTSNNQTDSPTVTSSETMISLATCSYILRCEQMPITNLVPYFPQVITLESTLLCHMPYVSALLERTELLANEKGLLLLDKLFKYIWAHSLDQTYLDELERTSLLRHVLQLTVFSPLESNRKKAFELFQQICDLLTYSCKHRMFISIMKSTELRACVRAACIDQYRRHLTSIHKEVLFLKNKILEDKVAEGHETEEWIRQVESLDAKYRLLGGQNLTEFLDLCIQSCLPEGMQTDVVENYELILATLSMLRFLKLRKQIFEDERENQYLTGQRMKSAFFEPIRTAIAHVISDLKETQKVSKADEADCLSWALCRLDLIESVLVKTSDLYE